MNNETLQTIQAAILNSNDIIAARDLFEVYYEHRKLIEYADQPLLELRKDIIIAKLWSFLGHFVERNSISMCDSNLSDNEYNLIEEIIDYLDTRGITSIL